MMPSPCVLSLRAVSRMFLVHEHPRSVLLRAEPAGLAARSCRRHRILSQVAAPREGVHRASSSQFAARDPSRSPHTLQPWVSPPCPGRSEASQTSITVEGPLSPVCRRLNLSAALSQHRAIPAPHAKDVTAYALTARMPPPPRSHTRAHAYR